jgi:hypothetical protein
MFILIAWGFGGDELHAARHAKPADTSDNVRKVRIIPSPSLYQRRRITGAPRD